MFKLFKAMINARTLDTSQVKLNNIINDVYDIVYSCDYDADLIAKKEDFNKELINFCDILKNLVKNITFKFLNDSCTKIKLNGEVILLNVRLEEMAPIINKIENFRNTLDELFVPMQKYMVNNEGNASINIVLDYIEKGTFYDLKDKDLLDDYVYPIIKRTFLDKSVNEKLSETEISIESQVGSFVYRTTKDDNINSQFLDLFNLNIQQIQFENSPIKKLELQNNYDAIMEKIILNPDIQEGFKAKKSLENIDTLSAWAIGGFDDNIVNKINQELTNQIKTKSTFKV